MNFPTIESQTARTLPHIIEAPEAREPNVTEFLNWARENRVAILKQLSNHGGLLFRGFGMADASQFEQFNEAMGFELMEYIRGNTPRSKVQNKVYTSTEIRNSVPIPLHNEMSYSSQYPSLIAFLCHTPSPVGGETPIADMHEVYQQVPPRIRDAFEQRGLRYTQIVGRRPHRFLKKTWTEMFDTEDKQEVERICAERKIDIEWGKRDKLRLNHVRPAVMAHPQTGKKIWFNQAHIFHPSFSRELKRFGLRLRAFLLGRYETFCRRRNPDGYPYNCTYGDGGAIPLRDIEEIRDILWSQAITFAWQQGDLVLLDNIQVAHARLPYRGPRLVLTSLIEGVKDCAPSSDVPLPWLTMGAMEASVTRRHEA